MIRKLLILIFVSICLLTSICKSQQNKDSLIYKTTVDSILTEFAKSGEVKEDKIKVFIPDTDKEYEIYLYYTDITSDSSKIKLYHDFNEYFANYLKHGTVDILKKYIEMAHFVDGYDAEIYFDQIEYLASHHNQSFCTAFNKAKKFKRERVSSYYMELCNK